MKKSKISFDFDSTLSRKDVQEIATNFLNKGFEVWCVTSRYDNQQPPKYKQKGIWIEIDNTDLFEVTDSIGIKRENIHFTNCGDKVDFIKDKGFLFHLDDDNYENDLINSQTNTKGIWCFGANDFKSQINKLCTKV